jgi:hypothetical protein
LTGLGVLARSPNVYQKSTEEQAGVPNVVALQAKWPPARRDQGAYLDHRI